MKIFDPKEKITLTTDASEHAVSLILSQNHPIMYLSRKLNKAKVNYSNIKKRKCWQLSGAQKELDSFY